VLYDVQSVGAQAYFAVADELMRRELASSKELHSDIMPASPSISEASA